MGTKDAPRPTDAELAILQILWGRGPATVGEIQTELAKIRPTGYTTVLKFLQIMLEKGLVTRDESRRSHVYAAKDQERTTKKSLVADLAKRAFGGSTARLVMQALSEEPLSESDRAEIETLLRQMRGT
jgi:BlaI family penicillinase repressor